jgi:hypothetical protein
MQPKPARTPGYLRASTAWRVTGATFDAALVRRNHELQRFEPQRTHGAHRSAPTARVATARPRPGGTRAPRPFAAPPPPCPGHFRRPRPAGRPAPPRHQLPFVRLFAHRPVLRCARPVRAARVRRACQGLTRGRYGAASQPAAPPPAAAVARRRSGPKPATPHQQACVHPPHATPNPAPRGRLLAQVRLLQPQERRRRPRQQEPQGVHPAGQRVRGGLGGLQVRVMHHPKRDLSVSRSLRVLAPAHPVCKLRPALVDHLPRGEDEGGTASGGGTGAEAPASRPPSSPEPPRPCTTPTPTPRPIALSRTSSFRWGAVLVFTAHCMQTHELGGRMAPCTVYTATPAAADGAGHRPNRGDRRPGADCRGPRSVTAGARRGFAGQSRRAVTGPGGMLQKGLGPHAGACPEGQAAARPPGAVQVAVG